MIPGYGSSRMREEVVASAASITVKADLVRITGTTQIDNILSPILMGRDGALIFVYCSDGNTVLGAGGNIAVGATLVQNRLYALAFSNIAAKWIIHGVV